MPPVDPHAVSAELQQRIGASLANWKRKLLDLSRRNRALNFKPTKVSTITIVDEHPAEVFRHICLDEATMRFKAGEGAAAVEAPPANLGLTVELEVDGEPAADVHG